VVKWQQTENLFARPESGWLVNGWLEMSDSVWVVDERSVNKLLVVLLVEELTANHQPDS